MENYWNENKCYDVSLKLIKQSILQWQCTNLGQLLCTAGMATLEALNKLNLPTTQCGQYMLWGGCLDSTCSLCHDGTPLNNNHITNSKHSSLRVPKSWLLQTQCKHESATWQPQYIATLVSTGLPAWLAHPEPLPSHNSQTHLHHWLPKNTNPATTNTHPPSFKIIPTTAIQTQKNLKIQKTHKNKQKQQTIYWPTSNSKSVPANTTPPELNPIWSKDPPVHMLAWNLHHPSSTIPHLKSCQIMQQLAALLTADPIGHMNISLPP